MPYLKITCPVLEAEKYAAIAQQLTNEVNDLFLNLRARLTQEELRERTTIHFAPYKNEELYVGGKTPAERGKPDITIELSDWSMSVKQQRKIAQHFTPVIAQLFGINQEDMNHINIRFHSYPPTDFAVGGRLLSDIIPYIGRFAKQFFE